MSSSELAGLITALGISIAAVLTAIAALRNTANSKEVVEHLRMELTDLTDNITRLKEHNVYQDELLMAREMKIDQLTRERDAANVKITELQEKVNKWQDWGFTMGRMMNQMQLEFAYLTQQYSKHQTAPLAALPVGEYKE